MNRPNHLKTREIQKSLETREKFPISYFDSRKYIQHNVALEDGLGPILALMDALPVGSTKVTPVRSFEDGDFSVAHLDYVLGDWGPMTGFEIHRWENDRIVEHWDNLQTTPATPNPAGHTMIDGETEVVDIERTEHNKVLVRDYFERVLIGGELAKLEDYHCGSSLIQHSPDLADGTHAMLAYLSAVPDGKPGPIYKTLHMLLGQGNMVLAVSEGELLQADGSSVPTAFYDLYRVSDGFVVEHWDVLQTIPPRAEWKNDNGKF